MNGYLPDVGGRKVSVQFYPWNSGGHTGAFMGFGTFPWSLSSRGLWRHSLCLLSSTHNVVRLRVNPCSNPGREHFAA